MTIIIIVIKLSIIIYETKIEENEYDSESDNEFLNERKLKYLNGKRSHSNNSFDSDKENLTFRKRKIKIVTRIKQINSKHHSRKYERNNLDFINTKDYNIVI